MLLRNVRTTNIKKGCYLAAFFVTFCVLSACRPAGRQSAQAIDLSDSTAWREGDIALRCGWGAESRAVTAKGQSTYSHVGLLHHDSIGNIWQVIHAVPGEDEPEYLKAEPLSVFYGSQRARIGAWLRVNCSDSIARQSVAYALWKVSERVLFDNDYLLNDTTQLYCTELVWRSYLTVGIDVSDGNRHDVTRFFSAEGECLLPSDIEMSKSTLYVKPLTNKFKSAKL